MALFAAVALISAPYAFAVPETGTAGPNSACDGELSGGLLVRLVERALTQRFLTQDSLAQMVDSEVPLDPFQGVARRTEDLSIRKAIAEEIQKFNGQTWNSLRPGLKALLEKTQADSTVKTESAQKTEEIFKISLVTQSYAHADLDRAVWAAENGEIQLFIPGTKWGGQFQVLFKGQGLRVQQFPQSNLLYTFRDPTGRLLLFQSSTAKNGPSTLTDVATGILEHTFTSETKAVFHVPALGMFRIFAVNERDWAISPLYAPPAEGAPRIKPNTMKGIYHDQNCVYIVTTETSENHKPFELIYRFDGRGLKMIYQTEPEFIVWGELEKDTATGLSFFALQKRVDEMRLTLNADGSATAIPARNLMSGIVGRKHTIRFQGQDFVVLGGSSHINFYPRFPDADPISIPFEYPATLIGHSLFQSPSGRLLEATTDSFRKLRIFDLIGRAP